jgi:hypothetical protein
VTGRRRPFSLRGSDGTGSQRRLPNAGRRIGPG